MNKRLGSIAFVSGFVLMSYELIAARILAPTIGSSVYVWTSVIGTIITALSIGYFIGGRLADRRAKLSDIAWLCIITALTILITLLIYEQTLSIITKSIYDTRIQGVLASLLLFVPASIVLGMLSPYLVKLRVTSLDTSGQSVANLSAFNSIGGIVGTFATGFVLFNYIGLRETLVLCIGAMLIVSWAVVPKMYKWWRIAISAVIIVTAIGIVGTKDVYAIDTPSAHYQITKRVEPLTNRSVTLLKTGPQGAQSGVYDDDPTELLFWYTHEMARVVGLRESKQRILMLGGGTFTLSNYLSAKYPNSQIDIVEIDPELEQIAKDYFGYKDRPNVQIIAEDARTYINQTDKTYDIVLVDVYSDLSVPQSLVTREYVEALGQIVNPNGAVVVNSISSLHGSCRNVLTAVHAAYSTKFDYATYTKDPRTPQTSRSNIVHTYARSPLSEDYGQILELPSVKVFTDNYAPTDKLQQQCLYN